MFQFFQKSIFDPNTCTLPKSPNNGFRWCLLGKLSHMGLEQLTRESTHIPTRLLTAWCDHPWKVGRPILTNKQCIVRNLQLVIPEVDNDGTLAPWGFHALDASLWNTLLRTLKHPGKDSPKSPPNKYITQTNSSPNHNGIHPRHLPLLKRHLNPQHHIIAPTWEANHLLSTKEQRTPTKVELGVIFMTLLGSSGLKWALQ